RFGMDYFIAAAMCALIIFAMSSSAAAGIIYVKWNSPGSGDPPVFDGLSWDTAFHKVQDGINASISSDDIWVAGDEAHPYIERITLKSGVQLFGGFSGTETSKGQRDWKANVTILDGNRSGSVVTALGASAPTTMIDGFTIRNGMVSYGGGIYCINSSPTIANNTITGNTAGGGGGISCTSASPTISNNTITGNTASAGGGIFCSKSSPMILNNTITGNSAPAFDGGGGIYCRYQSSPTIANNTITANSARRFGGGIYCYYQCSPTIANNDISGNGAGQGGGIRCEWSCSPVISGNRITGNATVFNAAGVDCDSSAPVITNNLVSGNLGPGILFFSSHPVPSGAVVAYNTIVSNGFQSTTRSDGVNVALGEQVTVRGNIVAFNGVGIRSQGAVTLSNNNVFGNVVANYLGFTTDPTGTNGNISLDPLFRDAAGEDYHLLWNSPCIDAGTNDGAPLTDLDGNPRPIDGNMDGLAITDMGAYEYVPIRVLVDVLPGDSTNIIQLQPNRMITVAILGTPDFDTRSVNPMSVLFGPGEAVEAHGRGHWEDVNGDGRIDLALHFRCECTGIQPGDTTVSLCGRLVSGAPFTGSDTIVAIGSKSKGK
ncbi:MAG: right-handed parallel beta-helix repeat-containing protein, partial [Armatimonadetes bacterium]|nr:right-handed parallel beta-helix repeat-containing protein [Armatimonadota bacterium]